MANKKQRTEWSSLPQDLLAMIAKKFHTGLDTHRFRAVCQSFRFSIPLPHPKISSLPTAEGIVLTESTVYTIVVPRERSSHGHKTAAKTLLVRIEALICGKLQATNLLSRWDSGDCSKILPKILNTLDYRISEITKSYKLTKKKGRFVSEKVVVSTCLHAVDYELAILALFRKGSEDRVGVWRMGDDKWTFLRIDFDPSRRPFFKDVVYHNQNFYVLPSTSSGGRIIIVDSRSLDVTEVIAASTTRNISRHLLKSSSKDLLLTETCYFQDSKTEYWCHSHLNVLKFDEENNEWVKVTDELQDKVLFLCDDFSIIVRVKEFPGRKGNCVYYGDRCGAEIFHLQNGTAHPHPRSLKQRNSNRALD